MEYTIYIETDFGEIKTYFETDGILKNPQEVYEIAFEKLEESIDIQLTGLLDRYVSFDIAEGKTLEDL